MFSFEWNNCRFTLVQYGKGLFLEDMTGHSHAQNSYELHYITGGEGALTTDTKTYPLEQGDFFVTGPGIYHQQSTNPGNPLEEVYIYIQASEKKTKDALVSTFLSTHFYFEKKSRLEPVFLRILKEKTEQNWGYECMVSALLQQLLTEITRLYWPDFNVVNENAENLNDRRFIIIENAFINDSEGITLAKLSDMIGLCERQTQRLLKRYYGKSFLEKKAEAKK